MISVDRVIRAVAALFPELRMGKVEVHWMSDDELLEINRKHLDHDYYTDIITFDYSRGSKISGELFISSDRVTENALKEQVESSHEAYRVVAHGILHLIGYGDKSEEEQIVMRSKEDEVLKTIYSV